MLALRLLWLVLCVGVIFGVVMLVRALLSKRDESISPARHRSGGDELR